MPQLLIPTSEVSGAHINRLSRRRKVKQNKNKPKKASIYSILCLLCCRSSSTAVLELPVTGLQL